MKTQTVSIRELVIGAIVVIVFALTSCASELRTGKYTIKAIRGNTVEFVEKEGLFTMPTDSLTIGKVVYIRRIRNQSRANVW